MEWNSLREQGHGTSEANAAIRSEARGVVTAETGQPWWIRSWFKSTSSPPPKTNTALNVTAKSWK